MRKALSMSLALLLCSLLSFAQTRQVNGKVTNEQGDPVPFATVKLKNSTTAVAADQQGNFSIEAGPNSVLVVSAVGFDSFEVTVGNQSTISVGLRSQAALQEVVVTALGIRRTRNQLPYAAQQVGGEEVTRTRSTNFVNNLSGKVSGLEIRQNNTLGGSSNIVIRGNKSLTGNNQALFVIDGVPFNNSVSNTNNQATGRGGYDYGNPVQDINPDDIESITVLKGAAATALYGSRGNNGVIVVNTRRGRKGLGVTVNTGVTFGSVIKETFATYQKQYGGGYGAYYESPDGRFLFRDIDGDGVEDLVTPTSEDASYGGRFDPNLQVFQWDAFDQTSANFQRSRPWVAASNDPYSFFEKPTSFNNSVYLDGGSDRGWFKLGYTRTDEKGVLPNSKLKRDLVNFGSSYNLTSKLTASATINFTRTEGKGRFGTGYDSKNIMTNFRQWWQTNVDIDEQKAAYFRTLRNVTWNWADPTNLVPIYWDNPYWTRHENYQTDQRFRYFGIASLNYAITDWLNVLGRVTLDSYDEEQEERIAIGSVDVSQYRRYNRTFREYNFDLILTADKNLNEDFNLKGLLGGNVRKNRIKTITATTNGGLVVPRLYSLSNSANPITAPLEVDNRGEVDGIFAGATLTYRDFLTLDATIRRDQSSTLPEDNNDYYYPSVSGGFVFSKLLTNATWLSYGKLRGNYAEVGNDAPYNSVLDYYTFDAPFGSTPIITVPGTKNNTELKPERTKSFEVGMEMAFLENRFGFDVTYYNAKTVDQILPVAVSNATGYNFRYVNSGTIENKGVEVSAFITPVKGRNFSWTMNVNWTRNRNKVTELFEGSNNLSLATFQGGVSINATLGQPYQTIRGTDYIYTDGLKTVGSNGRYLVTTTSNNVIGNANPDWIGGVNNTIRYKDLSLSFLVDVRQGGDVFSLDMYYGLATGLYPETAGNNDLGNPSRNTVANGGGVILEGVGEDGKINETRVSNANYGSFGYVYNPAKAFVYDASYVKLREVALTYSLSQNLISRLKVFKGIDVSVIGRNLWIIHKNLPYADPEDQISAGNYQGYQGGAYPATRTIGFNLKFRF